MCSLCGVLVSEHWAEAGEGRRARVFRVQLLNRVLGHFGLELSDWSGGVYVLRDRKGRSEVVPDLGALWQAIIFGGLSIVSVLIYRKFFRPLEPIGDQPLLNRKVDQMIGRTFVLHEPIVHGYGKIKVNDALWKVTGPELPVGTKVQVMGADGPTLKVQQTA